MAEQHEPVKRRVALKLIKLGMDSRQIVARFEAERQALAMMDHANIAKIFDGSVTETGRPYFVMELVRGIKITEYCDQNQLPTRERLKLFVLVCQAIQHAHQKGIIHRDIKPSNILVTLHDGVPVPKVIDFGIAKATQQELTEKTVFTQFQQFIGTPAYISPEQAEMSGLDIDTRVDIYSLGVLLYELLVGQTPLDPKEMMQGGLDALRQIIREKEPLRPSTRLNTLQGEARTTAGKRRQTEVGKLVHQLQGDLDWIVMRCLEKDRTRRYETANGLAMDIQRHLANEPIVARPPSGAYKLQKAWQRNKLACTAGAVIAVTLVAGIIGTTLALIEADRQRDLVDAQRKELAARNRALEAAYEHERLLNERARQAIETISSEVAIDQLTGHKELRPEQKELLGKIAIGQQLAADFLTRPEYRQELATAYNRLGVLLRNAGRQSEAERAYAEALAILKQLAAELPAQPVFRQVLAGIHNNLGNLLFDTGRAKEGESAHAEALAIRKQLVSDFPNEPGFRRALAMSHNNLGWVFQSTKRLKEAEASYTEAIALYKRVIPDFPNRPEFRVGLAQSYKNLGNVLSDTGRPKEAEAARAEALVILRQLVADFPDRPEFRQELPDAEGQRPQPVTGAGGLHEGSRGAGDDGEKK
jgi:serine/threonine-protein kinase